MNFVTRLQYEYSQVIVDLFVKTSHLSIIQYHLAFTFYHFPCSIEATTVWEIFIRNNLVIKIIRCVIFLWVSCIHENILPLNCNTII